jgi:hypothetical protein
MPVFAVGVTGAVVDTDEGLGEAGGMGWRQRSAVIGCTALLALSLTGCTDAPAETTTTSTPAAATPVVDAGMLLPVEPGTIAATGEFSGAVSGRVEVVRIDGGYRLDVLDLVLPDDRDYQVFLRSEAPASLECGGTLWAAALGHVTGSINLPPSGFFEDPSYLHGVQIAPGFAIEPERCAELGGYSIVDYAPLTWSLPDLRPDILPGDYGPRPGASGAVEPESDGSPSLYRIAPGDGYDSIASRFGLSADDLGYLNPVGDWTENPTGIQAGCTLNVTKHARGAATRCDWRS